MFDKNFKIKVSGNWCEYQTNKHIDLREIISFECWADQLGNPYRFHLKNGSYHYIERYEIGKQIENVLKEQQAKVEELQNQAKIDSQLIQLLKKANKDLVIERDDLINKYNEYDKLLFQRNKDEQKLYDINEKHAAEKAELQKQKSLQELEVNQIAQANQVWQSKCQELQKRVDKALELMQKPVIVGEPAKYVCSRFKELEQALKGEG